MNETQSKASTKGLIVVPAIITLAVTILRLVGEINRWNPKLFSRETGGPGALIGIVWLVPIFGVWFGMRLNRAGKGPPNAGRAIIHSILGLVILVGAFMTVGTFGKSLPWYVLIALVNVCAIVAGVFAHRGWKELGCTLLAYGYAARIPVAILMLVAMIENWGTHYELGMPGLPEMSLIPKWVVIGVVPQLITWIAFTLVVGSLFGTIATLFQRARR